MGVCFPKEIWNWPSYSEVKKRWKKEEDHSRLIRGGRFSKGGNLYSRLDLATIRQVDLCTHLSKSSKLIEALTKFSHVFGPDGLNIIIFFQGCVLENDSHCGNGGQKTHSKDKAGGEELPIAWVHLKGQLVDMSSLWPPATISISICLYLSLLRVFMIIFGPAGNPEKSLCFKVIWLSGFIPPITVIPLCHVK